MSAITGIVILKVKGTPNRSNGLRLGRLPERSDFSPKNCRSCRSFPKRRCVRKGKSFQKNGTESALRKIQTVM